jgi:hypothetical protein
MNAPLQVFLKRKEEELAWKLASLPEELKEWRERAREKNALQKNHSQINHLALQIEGLQAMIKADLGKAVADGELWRLAESLEKKALIVHTLWDQFRSQLSLRLFSPFDAYLALADAYARECYMPVYRQLRGIPADQLCPAPLITLDQEISPWMKPETAAPEASGQGDGSLLTAQQIQDALDRLPLTLLGLPWSYVTYLPHLALVAHEAGHAIERNAALTGALDLAIDRMPLDDETRRPAWKAWRKEVFADWYGCAMGGPAFLWSLVDHLANDENKIAGQKRPQQNGSWTEYPTATVRVLLGCRALEFMEFAKEAKEIGEAWSQAYPQNQLHDYSQDLDSVVNAFGGVLDLRQKKYEGFRRPVMDQAVTIANIYRLGGKLGKFEPKPARVYVAAARLIAQQPPCNATVQALWQKLHEHHLESQPAKVAGGDPPDVNAPAQIEQLAATLFARV